MPWRIAIVLNTILTKMLLLGEGDGGVLDVRKEPVALDQLIEHSLDMYQAVAEVNRIDLRAGPAATADRVGRPAAIVAGPQQPPGQCLEVHAIGRDRHREAFPIARGADGAAPGSRFWRGHPTAGRSQGFPAFLPRRQVPLAQPRHPGATDWVLACVKPSCGLMPARSRSPAPPAKAANSPSFCLGDAESQNRPLFNESLPADFRFPFARPFGLPSNRVEICPRDVARRPADALLVFSQVGPASRAAGNWLADRLGRGRAPNRWSFISASRKRYMPNLSPGGST